jgi:hypothetical protein
MKNWRTDPAVVPLLDGTRGSMSQAGQVGLAEFPAGTYPACSRHGALICVSRRDGIWRCLTMECNIGAEVAPGTVKSLGGRLRGRCFHVQVVTVVIYHDQTYDPFYELTCPDANCDAHIAIDHSPTVGADGLLECTGCHRRYPLPPRCPSCAGDGYKRLPDVTEPVADDLEQLDNDLERCPACQGYWPNDWQPAPVE